MSNDYFDSAVNRISSNSLAKSDHINDLRDELGVGFDKFPSSINIQHGSVTYCTDTGNANAYVVAMPYTATSYTPGMMIYFKPANVNTGASTINVDALGIKSIKRFDGTDVVAGDLVTTAVFVLVYDGTNFVISGITPASILQGYVDNAQAAQTASEKAQGLSEDAQDAAETAQELAESAQTAAETAYDNFDDRFLGAKATNPTLDNDGQALITGALHFNTTGNEMRVYTGSVWQAAFSTVDLGGSATSNIDMNDHQLNGSSYTQIADASLGTGTHTFNFANGDMQQLTATGDITIAFSNFVSGAVCSFIIEAVNWGDYVITHPATMRFASATAPSYTSGGIDQILVIKDKDDVYTLYLLGSSLGAVV